MCALQSLTAVATTANTPLHLFPPCGPVSRCHRRDAYEHPLPGGLDQPWRVLVRYSDGLGRTWEIRAPLDPHGFIQRHRRVRYSPFDRWRPRKRW